MGRYGGAPDGSLPLHDPILEKFCTLVCNGQPLSEASQQCGRPPDRANASRLARKPYIAARIAFMRRQRDERIAAEKAKADQEAATRLVELEKLAKATKAYVVGKLTQIAEIGTGDRSVKLKVRGKGQKEPTTVEVTALNLSAANKALELLGRELGMFEGAGAPKDDPNDLKGIAKRHGFDDDRLAALFARRVAEKKRAQGQAQ